MDPTEVPFIFKVKFPGPSPNTDFVVTAKAVIPPVILVVLVNMPLLIAIAGPVIVWSVLESVELQDMALSPLHVLVP